VLNGEGGKHGKTDVHGKRVIFRKGVGKEVPEQSGGTRCKEGEEQRT